MPLGSERLRRLTDLESVILRSLTDGKQISTAHVASGTSSHANAQARHVVPPKEITEPPLNEGIRENAYWSLAKQAYAHFLWQNKEGVDSLKRRAPRIALLVALAAGLESAAIDRYDPSSRTLQSAPNLISSEVERSPVTNQSAPATNAVGTPVLTAPDASQRLSVQESYGAWGLQCYGLPIIRCELSNIRPGANTVTANIVRARTEKQDTLNVIGPFSVLLKERARISIDGIYGASMNVVTCLQSGCVFQLKVDQELLDNLSQGTEMRAIFMMSNKQSNNLSISLSGLADAYIRMSNLLRS